MSVSDGGHGVDLEILVRGDVRNGLDWAPVSEGWLCIVEVLVGNSLQDVAVDVGNSLGDFLSWNSSAYAEDLVTDLLVDSLSGLVAEQLVVKSSSASDDLDVVQVVSVHGWQVDSAVVHLSGEHLIAEEIVSENTGIRVGEIVAVSSGHVWEVAQHGVHGVILLVAIVQVLGVLVDSVRAEHVLQQQEGVEVLVSGGWGIVEHTDVGVIHLIVSDHEQAWDVDWLLSVSGWYVGALWQRVEVLLNGINDLVVVDVSSGDDSDVVSIVVGGVEVSDVVKGNGLSQISVTSDWLSEHMLSEAVEVHVLEQSLLVATMVVLVILAHLVLAEFELSRVEGSVAKHISEDRHSS